MKSIDFCISYYFLKVLFEVALKRCQTNEFKSLDHILVVKIVSSPVTKSGQNRKYPTCRVGDSFTSYSPLKSNKTHLEKNMAWFQLYLLTPLSHSALCMKSNRLS